MLLLSMALKTFFLQCLQRFFFFKLLIKVFLALLTHFYIVKGNRKEAARIAEEIYGGLSGFSFKIDLLPDFNALDNSEKHETLVISH